MYRYFKKLAKESSLPSSFKCLGSSLHEECGNNVTEPHAPTNDANTNFIPSYTQRLWVDVSAFPSDLGGHQCHNIIRMNAVR